MRRSFSLALASVAGLAVAYGVACGGGGGGGNTDTGGSNQSGGKGQTGGGNPSGGNNPSGGSNPSGGNGGTGGKVSTGGSASGGSASGGSASGGSASGGTGNSATGGGSPTGGSGGTSTRPGGCPTPDGLISDFEEGGTMPLVIKSAIAPNGQWINPNDGTGTMTMAVESSGTADCQKYALHISGSGFTKWGATAEVDLNQAGKAAAGVDLSAYSGLEFKVKLGAGQSATSPIHVSWATLDTEPSVNDRGGMCTGDADSQCGDHTGRFLRDNTSFAAGSDWKTITMCFDADFMAMYLPEYVPAATRRNMAKRFLKLQFLTNKDQNPNAKETDPMDPHKGEKFDFWLDDVKVIKDCKRPVFASTDAAKFPFPQNKAPGSCSIIPNAAGYNTVLSDMYAEWKRKFVAKEGSGLKVIAVEQSGMPVLSEGMGYGMLISAAMGDKPTFDGIWATVNGHLTGGLLGWTGYSGNSATDGDEDIAYGLLMADKQWGGTYKASAMSMIAQIKAKDFTSDGTMKAGEAFAPFNPSYFSPAEYRAFGSDWASIITKNYGYVGGTCASQGLPTDWCNPSSGPINSFQAGANVTNLFCKDSGNCPVLYADDAARIPWRVGMDACLNAAAEGKTLVNKILSTLHLNGATGSNADIVVNGYTPTGMAHKDAVKNQASFIGALAVGAMADSGNAVALETAARAVFDIMDLPTYNQKYYSSSLSLITMLFATGNFPTP